MAIRRYARSTIIGINRQYGTSRAIKIIRQGIENGTIRFEPLVIRDHQRLDSISGEVYDDATAYWVIAAASNIGWALQVPPDTVLKIPNLDDVKDLVG